jgi:hypothetical protein
MSGLRGSDRRALESLERAITLWLRDGVPSALERWFERELDELGMPVLLGLPDWPNCVARLVWARSERPGWPKHLDARVLQFVGSLLRFSRTDGSVATVFDEQAPPGRSRADLSACAAAFPRSPESRVIGWWLNRADPRPVPPPLPACCGQASPLAALRASWQKDGDMLVLDHRRPGLTTRFELIGRGLPWLGPDWTLAGAPGRVSKPRCVNWQTSSVADLAEWTLRAGGVRLTRTALVLRGRRLALLAEQVDGRSTSKGPLESLYSVPRGIAVELIDGSRGLVLRRIGRGRNAQVLPLALPCLPYETDRGTFGATAGGAGLALKQMPRGRRCWMPLLVSWDGLRHRKRLSWRVLTVSEDARICPPDLAFAVRVSWGRDETYVLYRSLGTPGLRAFLGHQTRARFLVGRFTGDGTVEPLVSID